jgi:phospholipid/cholesterol/gamma-HCH transport system ATP-binding protein
MSTAAPDTAIALTVRDLRMAYGNRLIQQDINFEVRQGSVFAIMGGSGCGKSTLLRHLVGLQPPAAGQVCYGDTDYWQADEETQNRLLRHFGMLFQGAALFSTMTIAENVMLPLKLHGEAKSVGERRERAESLLQSVGLAEAADRLPSEISGGMKKRAGLARALALNPKILFLDEPSAGLDPISSRKLDELILELRDRTGAAVLVVSHELPSLFAIADDGIFLDAQSKKPIGRGSPQQLLDDNDHPFVQAFLKRETLPDDPSGGAPQ